ncbi:MAG: redox-sensing transcriptional repressor Rex [Bacteroidales bacterium]|nr:redox-sensing transcriptional repressor Rex [Bacteroidales bacterium]MCF8403445.1 redox-sensing transcriptional repressor Rex [Bacteroidales bacterium]
MNLLPDKTVERLSQYRRSLNNQLSKGKTHIFSHEIANLLHITPVQVRRDIMLIGYSGTLRKGYNIQELVDLIGKIIDTDEGQKIAVVGMGNLGKAFIHYLDERGTKLRIVAAFDINPEKIDKTYADVYCFHLDRLAEIVHKEGITIGIITTPPEAARDMKFLLRDAGVKGILNFTPKPLSEEEGIYLEEYDMITSLEKVAYFVKPR